MTVVGPGRLQEIVAVLAAEMRDVDHSKWIGGFDAEFSSGDHAGQSAAGLEDRQGAFQSLEVIDRRLAHGDYQNFQNGFFSA